MIAAAQGPQLWYSPFLGAVRHFVGQRTFKCPASLGQLGIAPIAISVLHHPTGAPAQHLVKSRSHQPHTTTDVESHTARRDRAALDIDGGDTADREAIPLMNVWHGQTRAHDARQRGNIHRLNQGLVSADLLDQRRAGGSHTGDLIARNAIAVGVDLL
jgi:hypothetical protein